MGFEPGSPLNLSSKFYIVVDTTFFSKEGLDTNFLLAGERISFMKRETFELPPSCWKLVHHWFMTRNHRRRSWWKKRNLSVCIIRQIISCLWKCVPCVKVTSSERATEGPMTDNANISVLAAINYVQHGSCPRLVSKTKSIIRGMRVFVRANI